MTEQSERDCVRELARKRAEMAASAENEAIVRRWRDVNALRKPDRAPVYCQLGNCQPELLPEESLVCADPWLRSIERDFRGSLLKREIGDDTPLESGIATGAVFDCDPPNAWGLDAGRHMPALAGGAWGYDPPLKTEADFDKLRLPVMTYNEAKSNEKLARFQDLLGDILPARLVCHEPFCATLCHYAANLRGLGQMLDDMAFRPDLVHRLMSHVADGVLGALRQVEATGLLTPNNTGPMFTSDPIGPEPADGRLKLANLWMQANSQEFEQVSPAMWEEFLLAYQMPILMSFGLSSYGCCEDLTQRIDGVLTIPNLRIFVASAWTDLDRVIERLGANYTIMWRQKASEVVFPDDTDGIERHLNDGMRRLKGCCYQVVQREVETLAGHRDRLHVWTRLAIDAAEKHA